VTTNSRNHNTATQTLTPRLVRRRDLERIYSIKVRTWAKYGLLGKGPKYRSVGGIAMYDLSDVEEWLNAQPLRGGIR
jgi:hypothetical protein